MLYSAEIMNKEETRQTAFSLGADFFGVADMAPFRETRSIPPGLADRFPRAISLGVALSREIIEDLEDGPTPHYSRHYATANALLDQIAFRLSGHIQRNGGRAMPVPASQILDEKDWLGAISHKAVARMAGLGWQGKSLLLINPEVGPRIRLVTVLTDLDLPPDQPLPNRCGKCTACADACPAGAIKGTPFGGGYADRAEAWDAGRCTDLLINDFGKRPGVDPLICGICIKACPVGRKPKTRQPADR